MQPTAPDAPQDPPVDARGLRVGMATSAYHAEITAAMEAAAVEAFVEAGGRTEDLRRVASPGAFELVAIASALAARPDIDAVVALGCIVRGETRHDRVLADAVAGGLASIAAARAKPVAFGVLTVERSKEARERAGGAKGNKGREAMLAALVAARAIESVRDGRPSIGEGRR